MASLALGTRVCEVLRSGFIKWKLVHYIHDPAGFGIFSQGDVRKRESDGGYDFGLINLNCNDNEITIKKKLQGDGRTKDEQNNTNDGCPLYMGVDVPGSGPGSLCERDYQNYHAHWTGGGA
jgi:hypothetical protein